MDTFIVVALWVTTVGAAVTWIAAAVIAFRLADRNSPRCRGMGSVDPLAGVACGCIRAKERER